MSTSRRPRFRGSSTSANLIGWVALALLSGAAPRARAAPRVDLALEPPLPFTADEIARAVAARLSPNPAQGPRRAFLVGPVDGGIVRLRVGDKLVYVPTGDRQGASAARVVALVIADLAADEIVPAAAVPAAARASGEVTRAVPAAPRPPGPMRLTLGAVLSKGLGGEEMPCYGVEADLVGRAIGRITWGTALGLVVIPHQDTPQPDGFSYTAGIARLLVAWRLPGLELLAGPFASRYALGGSSHHTGTLAGAGVSARLAPALSHRLRLVVGVRVEGYANRIHATWSTQSGFATPRVAAALSVGVAWELGS